MPSNRLVLTVSLAVVLLGATWPGVATAGDELASQLKQRVGEVLAGSRPMSEIRVEAVWNRPDKHDLIVLGSGAGVWNLNKQFRLTDREMRAMLQLLVSRGYFELPEHPKPTKASDHVPQAPVILRAIIVRVGDLERTVAQNTRVLVLQSFDDMVSDLFTLCEKPAASGTMAETLEDGLRKVASGKLAPEVLEIVLNEPPVASTSSRAAEEGLVVVLKESVLTSTTQFPGAALLRQDRHPLPAEQVRALAAVALEGGVASLPINLFRPRYVDLQVAVLNQRKNLQARAFAGMDPGKHVAEQQSIERFVDAILALRPAVSGAS